MSITLVRCPVGCASPDIVVVVIGVFLRSDLLPALLVTTLPPPLPATVLLIFLGENMRVSPRFFARVGDPPRASTPLSPLRAHSILS